MTKVLFAAIAAAAGVASVVQGAANAGLSARIGLTNALLLNTVVVLVATLVFHFARGVHFAFFPPGVPWSLYVGGFCGFVIIVSMAVVFPKIGAAVAIALVVLGQGAAALAIDHYGLMGMPREPVTLARILGIVLLGGGVVLIRA